MSIAATAADLPGLELMSPSINTEIDLLPSEAGSVIIAPYLVDRLLSGTLQWR